MKTRSSVCAEAQTAADAHTTQASRASRRTLKLTQPPFKVYRRTRRPKPARAGRSRHSSEVSCAAPQGRTTAHRLKRQPFAQRPDGERRLHLLAARESARPATTEEN